MNQTIARLKTNAKLRFPRLYEAVKSALPSTRERKKHLHARSAEDIFTEIYSTNGWRNPESKSGGGSSMTATAEIREQLPALLSELGVKVLIDAPCGDYNWMRHVELPVEQYIGGEIVPELVDRLNDEFHTAQRRFAVLDLTTDTLPAADALFCRDLFLHLSFDDIERVHANFVASECRYLITSTYPDVKVHFDILTGEVRPVNMLLPPFSWPEPIRLISDNADEKMNRRMGVWRRDQF